MAAAMQFDFFCNLFWHQSVLYIKRAVRLIITMKNRIKENKMEELQMAPNASEKETSTWRSLFWFALCLLLLSFAYIFPTLVP
jgi:hypothetical protein